MITTRVQLRSILLGFFIVAAVSAWVTYVGTKDHNRDHNSLDLTDNQRELAQMLSWMVLVEPNNPAIEDSIAAFEGNMQLLRRGGEFSGGMDEVVKFDPEEDEEILEKLAQVSTTWVEFRNTVRNSGQTSSSNIEFNQNIRNHADQLALLLDDLGMAYAEHMEADLNDLRQSQALLLLVTIPLLIWAIWIFRYRIVRPADILATVFSDVSLDDIAHRFQQKEVYADEVMELRQSFDEMRPKIEAATRALEIETVNQTQQLMKALEASQEIVGQLELNPLLKLVTYKAETLLQANSAAICLVEKDGSYLELVSARGKVATRISFDHELHTGNKVIRIGPTVENDSNGPCPNCAFSQACGSDSCLSAPLKVGSELVGSICVVRDPGRPFDGNDLRSINLLGKSAAVAVVNARLSADTQFKTKEQAINTERERLRAELHDSLGQTLSYLNLKVNHARELVSTTDRTEILSEIEEIQSATSTAYGQMRNALNSLQDPILGKNDSVYHGLLTFVVEFRQRSKLQVEMLVDQTIFDELPILVQQQALYIVREAFTNVYRHAQASQITFTVERRENSAIFTIEDDGIGFDPDQIDQQNHLGVSIMQARAQRCGGQLFIHSNVGEGSSIQAIFELVDRRN